MPSPRPGMLLACNQEHRLDTGSSLLEVDVYRHQSRASSPQSIATDWSAATVAEPLGFADDNFNTVGALVLHANTPTIFSLQPGEDFELNTDIIHQWKLIFQDSENQVIGDADYQTALKELHPYVLDQQNGSILVRPLSDAELDEIYSKTVFA